MAGLADQMKVARLPVRVLEPEAPFTEVDFAGDAGVDHPLQRAIDGRAADAVVLATNQIDEIVRAEVPLLAQEEVDDLLTFVRVLAADRLQSAQIGKSRHDGYPGT